MAVCAFNVVQALYAKMQGTRKQQQGDGSDGFNSFTSGDSAATFGPEGLLTYESDHVLREDHISAIPPSSEDWKDLQGLGDLVGLPFELFSPEIAASNIANMPPPHPLHNLIVQAGFGEGTSWSADDDALF